MTSERRPAWGHRVRTKLLIAVAVPSVACLVSLAVFFASHRMMERAYTTALTWSHHVSEIRRIEACAVAFMNAVDSCDHPTCTLKTANDLNSARVASAQLAEQFSEKEQREELEVSGMITELLERGTRLTARGNREEVDALHQFFQANLLAKLHDRIEEEERGSRETARHGEDVTSRTLYVGSISVSLLVISGLFLSGIFVRSITISLLSLRAGTEAIAAGDLQAPVHVNTQDEFGQLAEAFNTMAGRLDATMVNLEALVQARTADLTKTTNRLQESLHRESQTREQIIQVEKLSAIGQLAAGVAHEINNPLAVILGFAQGMERRVPEGDALSLPVTSIVREALRCKVLVQELLTFARTGKKSTEHIDLNEVIEASLTLLRARAHTQDVAILLDLAEVIPSVLANRTQIQQVLINLGTNALDATPGGGTITVRTFLEGTNTVCLEVIDTGAGIPTEVRSRIFDPFFTTKEPGKGTGLGLSLVYEIVQTHGGMIAAAGRNGGGTVMRIELPTEDPAPQTGESS